MLYKGKTWQDSGILWNTLAYFGILWHTPAYWGWWSQVAADSAERSSQTDAFAFDIAVVAQKVKVQY